MTPEQEARLKHKAQRHPDYFGSCGYIECRAARAAAPSVEPHEHEYERGAHMAEAFGVDGRKLHCAICGAASPEPTPGLREAIPTISRDLFHGHHPNCGWTVEADPKACDCVVVLRAALAASPAPEPRVAPCDDEQLEAAFMKGVESAAEARAVQAEYAAPEPTGLDAARVHTGRVLWPAGLNATNAKREVIVELKPVGPDGVCTGCGSKPTRETGSCRCLLAIAARLKEPTE